jgi:hypothetical protein
MDTPQRSILSRRSVVKSALGVTVAAGTGLGAIATTSSPATAASLNAANVDVTSNDGSLSTLTIAPDVTVTWSGQESGISNIDYVWNVSTGNNSGQIDSTSQSITGSPTSGDTNKVFPSIDLLQVLSAGNFGGAPDGETSSGTDVTVSLKATLKDTNGNIVTSKDPLLTATFTVSVTNQASTTGGSGTANTSGS